MLCSSMALESCNRKTCRSGQVLLFMRLFSGGGQRLHSSFNCVQLPPSVTSIAIWLSRVAWQTLIIVWVLCYESTDFEGIPTVQGSRLWALPGCYKPPSFRKSAPSYSPYRLSTNPCELIIFSSQWLHYKWISYDPPIIMWLQKPAVMVGESIWLSQLHCCPDVPLSTH